MSKYTTQIRNVIENGYSVMPSDYSYYDSSRRLEFENLFIDHYYFSEIGFETLGLFKHRLRSHLNMIMPKYVMLFETKLKSYDPYLVSVYKETMKREGQGTSEGESNTSGVTSGKSNGFSAVVPQSGLDGKGLEYYMSDADKAETNADSTSLSKSNQTGKTQDNSERTVHGNLGKTYVQQMVEMREYFVNLDKEIIESCNDLFMLIY